MREDGVHQLFFSGLKVHRNNKPFNQLGHFCANHMSAQKLSGLLVENGFDHALIFTQSDSLAIGNEAVAADANVMACFLSLRFRKTDRGNLWVAVGASGNFTLVQRMNILFAGELFDANNGFMLCLVGQHRRTCNITNGIDTVDIGLAIIIDHNAAAIRLDAKLFKPVIAHTLSGFLQWGGASAGIVVVIHRDDEALFRDALSHVSDPGCVHFVHGGATRQQSVLNGLDALKSSDPSHVLIHDAVRPFFDAPLLDRICAALKSGNDAVLPAIAVSDTLKQADANQIVSATVSRAGLFSAQTPQAFSFGVIFDGHNRAANEKRFDFTDDCGIAEWAGISVRLVEGLADNVKLTFQRDIAMADEKLSQNLIADIRTGNGYDVHKLLPGDGVTLCGVHIPYHMTLSGHSDADVAFHALTDALLATCGEGDIGDHFPPSDPQWKGAASHIFLAHAAKIVRENGGAILNADVSLIAEAPKIGPHRMQMREEISKCLGIDMMRCSVKATTNETIGFVGRGEGIAAIATASVSYGTVK